MNSLSKDQYKRLAKPKRHKYKAQSTRDLDGVECPSKLHAACANMLIARREKKQSLGFFREVAVRLKEKCSECGAAAVVYKVDFKEIQLDGSDLYLEAKGEEVPSFKKRKRLWPKSGPAPLEIWKGRYSRGQCIPYLAETIYPSR